MAKADFRGDSSNMSVSFQSEVKCSWTRVQCFCLTPKRLRTVLALVRLTVHLSWPLIACVLTHTHTHTYAHAHTHTHVHTHTCTHVHAHTYTHVHTHTCTHTCTHTKPNGIYKNIPVRVHAHYMAWVRFSKQNLLQIRAHHEKYCSTPCCNIGESRYLNHGM